ncbi:MAG: plasmid mobilization relaxosome protein MobC [Atopobiaceae bacterium]|nr:plasmid mobilization relaxosome protein MobC [Atopobiaceae bacterium]
MADVYEIRSGKATRQRHERSRRDKVVQVRMSNEELSLLDERRGRQSRSNFLRGALYERRQAPRTHVVVLDVPLLDRVRMELNRIGVNVNQIARERNRRPNGMRLLDATRERMTTGEAAEAFDGFRDSVDKLRAEVEGLRADLQAHVESGGDV